MLRWAVRIATAFSVVLCAGVVFLAIRGQSTRDRLTMLRETVDRVEHQRTVYAVECGPDLRISRETLLETGLTPEQADVLRQDIAGQRVWEWTALSAENDDYGYSRPHSDRAEVYRETWTAGDRKVTCAIPYRLLIVATILLAGFAILRFASRLQRRRKGSPRRPGRLLAGVAALSAVSCALVLARWAQSEVSGLEARRLDSASGATLALSVARVVSMPGRVHVTWAHLPTPQMPPPITLSSADWLDRMLTSSGDPNVLNWTAPDGDPVDTESWMIPGFVSRHWAGFSWAGIGWAFEGSSWGVEVVAPYWLLLIFTAAIPAFYLAMRSGWVLRRPPGLCGNCGYDLRASAGLCPECGEPVRAAAARAATAASPTKREGS